MSSLRGALTLGAAAVALACVFAWLAGDKQFRREAYEAGSLHNIGDKGGSLAFRYLKERRPVPEAVRELDRTIDQAQLEKDAVVFRIDPQHIPGVQEVPPGAAAAKPPVPPPAKPVTLLTTGEEQWVRGGGRIVLALRKDYRTVTVATAPVEAFASKTFPLFPGIEKLRASTFSALSGSALDEALTLFADKSHTLGARIAYGAGDVIVLGSPDIFENAALDQDAYASLLEALAPRPRQVYFDEFVHGLNSPPGIFEMLRVWGLGMALCLAVLAGVCAFWRAATPVGAPVDAHRERRTQAVDFVGSVAPLYDQALTNRQALSLQYENFVRAVTLRTGLRGEELQKKLASVLGPAADGTWTETKAISKAELQTALQALNAAMGRFESAHRR